MPRTSTHHKVAALAVGLFAPLMMASQCLQVLNPTVNNATAQLEASISRLSQNPTQWLAELRALEAQLKTDGSTLVGEVDAVLQRGIAATGETVRCTVDFTGRRMESELRRILARLKNQPLPEATPYVCTVSPDRVDLGGIPQAISFSGYDLNVAGLSAVAIDATGSQQDLSTLLTQVSEYELILNLSGNRANLRCDHQRIALQWAAGQVTDQANQASAVPLVWPICSNAPSCPPPAGVQQLFVKTGETCNGGLTGCKDDRTFGGRCTNSFERDSCQVIKNAGAGHCEMSRWANDDNTDCSCVVHFGAPAANGVNCDIKIFEKGLQPPCQPPPPCACRNGVPPS